MQVRFHITMDYEEEEEKEIQIAKKRMISLISSASVIDQRDFFSPAIYFNFFFFVSSNFRLLQKASRDRRARFFVEEDKSFLRTNDSPRSHCHSIIKRIKRYGGNSKGILIRSIVYLTKENTSPMARLVYIVILSRFDKFLSL